MHGMAYDTMRACHDKHDDDHKHDNGLMMVHHEPSACSAVHMVC